MRRSWTRGYVSLMLPSLCVLKIGIGKEGVFMVRLQSISAACAAALAITSPSLAKDEDSSPHTFSLGAEGFFYNYREPNLMEDKGALFGLNGEYFYTFQNNLFLGMEGRIALGQANYKSKGTGRAKNFNQFIFEPRFLLGYDFHLENFTIAPYVGLGYRFKSDYSAGKFTTTGHYGYDRESQYFYLPLGLKMNGDFSEKWDWQARTEFDILLAGSQLSKIPHNKTRHHQDSGWGAKVEYLVGHKFTSGKLSFGPFFNYWDIDDSNIVNNLVEPKNYTVELGLKAKWTF